MREIAPNFKSQILMHQEIQTPLVLGETMVGGGP